MNYSQQFYSSAKDLLSKIGTSIEKIENESFLTSSMPSIPTMPTYATLPTVSPTTNPTQRAAPTTEPTDDHLHEA